MTRFYQNKKNKQTYKATKMASGILLENVVSDERKTIAENTLHRYYEEVQPVQPAQPKADKQVKTAAKQPKQPKQPVADKTNKYPYYRHYERNQQPLWNTTIEGNVLYINDEKGNKIIKCNLSKTGNCIRIEQLKLRARRYFTNFARAKRHIVYDQDIKTTQYVGDKFDKWLKDAQKALASNKEDK